MQAASSNSGTWGAGGTAGDDLNTGCFEPLDTMLAGVSTFSVGSSNISLSFTAGGGGDVQNCLLRFTGVLLASIVVSPAAGNASTYFNGFYFFENLATGSFTITLTTGTGSVVLPQGRRGIFFVDQVNAPRIIAVGGSTEADPVPAGSVMLFYNAAAPSGWTVVSADDWAVRIASSAAGTTGGSSPFSTAFTNRTILQANLPAVSFTGTYAHTHNVSAQSSGGVGSGNSFLQAASTGGGAIASQQPDTATITVSSGGSSTAMNFAVRYYSMLLATRN